MANSSDDMHCVNAVFRMIHRHFLGTDLTWKEIDTLTHAIPNKGTWTFVCEMEFAKKGIGVTNIEPVDYEQLYREGAQYLTKIVGKDTAAYYLEKTNIDSVIKYIPEYLKFVKHETRKARIEEIVNLLKEDNLVAAEVNSNILNNTPGFNLHFVLLYDFDKNQIILHDPGLPPKKSRKVTLADFEKCLNFPGSNAGIVVFRKLR